MTGTFDCRDCRASFNQYEPALRHGLREGHTFGVKHE